VSELERQYEDDPQVVEVIDRSNDLVSQAQELEIVDEATDSAAKSALATVTTQKRDFEKLRKSFTQPLNDHVKKINLFFKGQATPLDQTESILKQKVGAYYSEQQAAARKEEERLRKLAAKRAEKAAVKAETTGEPVAPAIPAPTVATPVKTTKTDAGSVTMRTVHKWEIEDVEKIPREFMIPDEKKIKTMVDAKIPVPGVRAYSEQVPVVRGRS